VRTICKDCTKNYQANYVVGMWLFLLWHAAAVAGYCASSVGHLRHGSCLHQCMSTVIIISVPLLLIVTSYGGAFAPSFFSC